MDKVLVSACLLGHRVRFDGGAKPCRDPVLARWVAEGRVVALCPEVAAGSSTPRPPAEIASVADGRGGGPDSGGIDGERHPGGSDGADVLADCARVMECTGRDVTAPYLAAARLALDLARARGCRVAVLTDRSPSCGSRTVHDGTFGGVTRPGRGVTAALLSANGIEVFPEAEIEVAVLTDRSPSCGSRRVHDGTIGGVTRPGRGVTAAFLSANGIEVFPEAEIEVADRVLRAAPP